MQRDETRMDREGSTARPDSKEPVDGQVDLLVEEIMADSDLIDRLWDEYFLDKYGRTPLISLDENGRPIAGNNRPR